MQAAIEVTKAATMTVREEEGPAKIIRAAQVTPRARRPAMRQPTFDGKNKINTTK